MGSPTAWRYSSAQRGNLGLLQEIAEVGIELIVSGIPAVYGRPEACEAPREPWALH